MEKERVVRERPPVELLDLAGVEAWLEARSGRGLHFEQWGMWCRFSVGEPKKRRWRLDPNRPRGIAPAWTPAFEELKENYREMGWTYHSACGSFYLFYSEDPSAPDLYHDPQSKAMALNKLVWRQARRALAWLLLLGVMVWTIWSGKTGSDPFFRRYEPGTLLLLFILPLLAANLCRSAWFLNRVRAKLRKGGEMPSPPEWFLPFSRFYRTACVIWGIAVLATFASGRIYRDADVTLPGVLPPEPFLSLEELEQGRALHYENEAGGWAHPMEGTYLRSAPSFLSRRYIESSQEASSTQLWWDELAPGAQIHERYHCGLVTRFWDVRWEFLASRLYAYLLETQSAGLTAEPIELNWAEEALCLRSEEDRWQILIARAGKRVVYVRYYGAGQLRERLLEKQGSLGTLS